MMETVIKVNGMMCTHCKARVEKICKAVPGTVDAVVDLHAKTVTVRPVLADGATYTDGSHTVTAAVTHSLDGEGSASTLTLVKEQ